MPPRDPRFEGEPLSSDVEEIIRDFMSPERAEAAKIEAAERDRAFRDSFLSLMNRTGELRGDIAELRTDIGQVREQGVAQFRELKTDFLGLAARVSKTEEDIRTIRVGGSLATRQPPWGAWVILTVAVLFFVAAVAVALHR
jgi:hypothetical protein